MKKLPLTALALLFFAFTAMADQPDPGKWQFVYTVAESEGAMVQVVKDERGVHVRVLDEKGNAARMTAQQSEAVGEAFKDAEKIDHQLKVEARRKGKTEPQKDVNAANVSVLYVHAEYEDKGKVTSVYLTTHNDPIPARITVKAAKSFSKAMKEAAELAPKIDKSINP